MTQMPLFPANNSFLHGQGKIRQELENQNNCHATFQLIKGAQLWKKRRRIVTKFEFDLFIVVKNII